MNYWINESMRFNNQIHFHTHKLTDSLIETLLMKTTLHTSKFLALIKEGHWEYVDRVNATGAAILIAVTAEQNVLLVEQYRIPVHARTIELPAGITGDEPGSTDESHAEAARRELLEETGYTAGRIEAV